jgi:hypothetical protein
MKRSADCELKFDRFSQIIKENFDAKIVTVKTLPVSGNPQMARLQSLVIETLITVNRRFHGLARIIFIIGQIKSEVREDARKRPR